MLAVHIERKDSQKLADLRYDSHDCRVRLGGSQSDAKPKPFFLFSASCLAASGLSPATTRLRVFKDVRCSPRSKIGRLSVLSLVAGNSAHGHGKISNLKS